MDDATIRTTTADRAAPDAVGAGDRGPEDLARVRCLVRQHRPPVRSPTLGDGQGQGQRAHTYLRDRADLSSETEPVPSGGRRDCPASIDLDSAKGMAPTVIRGRNTHG
jgi:hypothetical protein